MYVYAVLLKPEVNWYKPWFVGYIAVSTCVFFNEFVKHFPTEAKSPRPSDAYTGFWTISHAIIGSRNGLVSDSTYTLPEPPMAYCQLDP